MHWIPLPKIAHAVAIYSFSPPTVQQKLNITTNNKQSSAGSVEESDDKSTSSISLPNISGQQQSTDTEDYNHFIPLEIGDELFITEQYGEWYRGYVITTLEEGRRPNKASIGCFPANHVQIKEYINFNFGESKLLTQKSNHPQTTLNRTDSWKSETSARIPRSLSDSFTCDISDKRQPFNRTCSANDIDFKSLESFNFQNSKSISANLPPPPLSGSRFEQSTLTGDSEPLVDEIAACVNDWNSLLYKYLNQRDYQTFNSLKDHISNLLQARKQIMEQALSREELFKLKKKAIEVMITVNMKLHQNMIIRHPEKGYLLNVTNTSLSTIYRMHWKYATKINSSSHINDSSTVISDNTLIDTLKNNTELDKTASENTVNSSIKSPFPIKSGKFYHLYLELKACVAHICQPGEYTELYFALYSTVDHKFITENYVAILNHEGFSKDETQIEKLQTLFIDLSLHDIVKGLYLVCHVIRLGSLKQFETKDHHYSFGHFSSHNFLHGNKNLSAIQASSSMCRQPFGCAVFDLNIIFRQQNSNGIDQQTIDMPIFIPDSESSFSTFHEEIITSKDFIKKNPSVSKLTVSIRSFYGQLDEILNNNSALLQDIPQTLRIGFPDVAFPNESRNELYIRLDEADLSQFGKARNIQITMCVRDNKTGDVVENALSVGTGTAAVTYWESMVFYHEQKPKWGELIKVQIHDLHVWERSHVFITVKHKGDNSHSGSNSPKLKFGSNNHSSCSCSSNLHQGGVRDTSSGLCTYCSSSEKIISIGFLPLFLPPSHHDFVADGSHTIFLYKYDRQTCLPKYYINTVPWCIRSTAPINISQQFVDTPPKFGKNTNININNNGDIVTQLTSSLLLQQQMSIKLLLIRDTITLSTFLCSTKFTQNKTLAKLLHWRSLLENSEDGPFGLLTILNQFTFVGEVEVVKFLKDTFNVLLDIMNYEKQKDGDPIQRDIHNQVLTAIIWLLGIVQDRRFSNFRPVLDIYIDDRFSTKSNNELTFKYLIRSLTRLCENPGDPSKAKLLRSSMKVWGYLFRIIAKSCQYQQQTDDDDDDDKSDSFDYIKLLLTAITRIMDAEHPNSMIGTQTLTLQHFADIVVELQKIISSEQLIDVIVSFIDSCSHVTGRLIGYKLATILNVIKGPIFNDYYCRSEITKHTFRWIKHWLNSYTIVAKHIIFSGQYEDSQRTRLQKTQWIENLRLSLTIMCELLDNIRRFSGTVSSGLFSSSIINNHSRPTSYTTSIVDGVIYDYEHAPMELRLITDEALRLIPQLLDTYKDLQRLTNQAIQVANTPQNVGVIDTNDVDKNQDSKFNSVPSVRKLRERATSVINNNNENLTQYPHHEETRLNSNTRNSINSNKTTLLTNNPDSTNKKCKFTIVLQALATSPPIPFPRVYPFPSDPHSITCNNTKLTTDQIAMISTGLLDLTVVILEIFYLTTEEQWSKYIKDMLEKNGLEMTSEFLRKIVYTCMGILFGDNVMNLEETSLTVDNMSVNCNENEKTLDNRTLPHDWLNLTAIAHKIVLCNILNPIKSILEKPEFIPSPLAYCTPESEVENTEHFDNVNDSILSTDNQLLTTTDLEPPPKTQHMSNEKLVIQEQKSALLLWRVYFVGIIRVIGSPTLDLSNCLPQTQRTIYKITGDMRFEVGAPTLTYLWNLAEDSAHAFNSHNSIPDIEENHKTRLSNSSDYFSIDIDFNNLQENSTNIRKNSSDTMDSENQDINRASISNYVIPNYKNNNSSSNYYPVRYSIRIAPTDEAPLESINEENYTEADTNIPFLQVDLYHYILTPLCVTSLTYNDFIRKSSLAIIADIIAIELYSFGELIYVQKTLIGALDHLIMCENKADEGLASCIAIELSHLLNQRLQADNRTDLQSIGKKIIESLNKFFRLLLQIRSLPANSNEYMDERIIATLRLMKFIKVIEREEVYRKYVHQLVQLHLNAQNFVEAALTLRFHSDLLRWDPSDELASVPELSLPTQSSFDRKESLYMKMLNYLDQANAWEICIQICKELAYAYENVSFDYSKLSAITHRQAIFSENIAKKERCFTQYFRVGFYGRGFPEDSNRNKQFIFRGLEWEKVSSFIERMQNKHPNAIILPSKIANSISLTDEQLKELNIEADGQYIQITPVVPIPDIDSAPCLSNPHAPECVKEYYAFNNVTKFSYSRPEIRTSDEKEATTKNPESEFLNLWTEKIEFECEDTFPTIVKRSKIISAHSTMISPIENAVEAVENKNKELKLLEKKYSSYFSKDRQPFANLTQPINISPFSMSLNGAVDAPVNGGIPLYKKAFLTGEYWEENPNMRHWIERLKVAIQDQATIIQQCLNTHNKLVSSEMRPFHSTLLEFFHKNFEEEIMLNKGRTKRNDIKQKSGPSLTIDTINPRISQLSSSTDNNSIYSHNFQHSHDDLRYTIGRQNTMPSIIHSSGIPASPTAISPISRAFSLKTPITENSPGIMSIENAPMSRAESISHSIKMSLRKKSRRKTQGSNSLDSYASL